MGDELCAVCSSRAEFSQKNVAIPTKFDFMLSHDTPTTQLTRHTTHGHKMKVDIVSRAGHPTHATHQIARFDAEFDFMFSHAPHTHLTRHTNHTGGQKMKIE